MVRQQYWSALKFNNIDIANYYQFLVLSSKKKVATSSSKECLPSFEIQVSFNHPYFSEIQVAYQPKVGCSSQS
jgi:hypothetical protein